MTGRGIVSRGDLLLALSAVDDDQRAGVAALVGFKFEPPKDQEDEPVDEVPGGRGEKKGPRPPVTIDDSALASVPFVIPSHLRVFPDESAPPPPPRPQPKYKGWSNRGNTGSFHIPLCSWDILEPRLRRVLDPDADSNRIDMRRSVDLIARNKSVERFPRKPRRAFSGGLTVILDRSIHLTPFWYDQDLLVAAIQESFPVDLNLLVYDERTGSLGNPQGSGANEQVVNEIWGDVLVLSDLGFLSGLVTARHNWKKCLEACAADRVVCLSPVLSTWLGRYELECHVVPWELPSGADQPVSGQQPKQDLLHLVGPLVRLEPSLLRAVRKVLRPNYAPDVETLIWKDSALQSKSSIAASFNEDEQKALRTAFDTLTEKDRSALLGLAKCWRNDLHEAVWFEELINLSDGSRQLAEAKDVAEAQAFFADLASQQSRKGLGAFSPATLGWLSRVGARATPASWQNEDFRAVVGAMAARDPNVIPEVDPREITNPAIDVRRLYLDQNGGSMRVGMTRDLHASPFAILPATNPFLAMEMREGSKPTWADRFGTDGYGDWAEIEIAGVTQRLRFIPAGSFWIGSPEGEVGRWEDEGPQAEIKFAEGFWLFDTAVTNGFWAATMGEEAGDHPEHPKLEVSWLDAQGFNQRVSERRPGLELRLPSESEWEYACRAGTKTPYFFGETARNEEINFDSGGTVAVKDRPANSWGLYHMHGNVFECCEDIWANSHDGIDPTGAPRAVSQQETDQARVARGGSWSDDARYVRAAYRVSLAPDLWDGNLGFRCALVQASLGSQGGRDDRFPRREAEPRPGDLAVQRPNHARVSSGRSAAMALPSGPFVLRTDRAELTFQRITQQDLGWASALGRDRYGLWSRFAIGAVETPLRWIPPGQFMIGSPKGELGRYDWEGPRTEITIGEGFWLMDAPVTRSLWEALGQDNPSRFKSPDRPVEEVSWVAAKEFCSDLTSRLSGLRLDLPSEAQWEYACRAGTVDATYAGPMEILGERNAPVLNDIAWYGGNSGVGFELEDGHDSSNWNEKAFDHDKAGTRPVRLKKPNSWGCYDMLGNVFEWCEDPWADSHDGIDPTGAPRAVSKQETDQARVVRGGSWLDFARYVRAAYRLRSGPEDRNADLGFRCASVQASPASSSGQDDRLSEGEAEPPLDAPVLADDGFFEEQLFRPDQGEN